MRKWSLMEFPPKTILPLQHLTNTTLASMYVRLPFPERETKHGRQSQTFFLITPGHCVLSVTLLSNRSRLVLISQLEARTDIWTFLQLPNYFLFVF